MNSTADKCYLLVSSHEKLTIKISGNEITNTKREKLSGIHLIAKCHLISIYRKFAKYQVKVCALPRVTSSMSLSKKRTLMNVFFKSQFNYVLSTYLDVP